MAVQGGLKPSQEKFLAGMLEGMGFSELCRELEMTKANGALLLGQLEALGLIVKAPGRAHKRLAIDPGKSGSVVWWDAEDENALLPRKPGPARWWVFATPIPRYERTDVRPDTWAVVVTAPWGQVAFTLSDRERLSYRTIDGQLTMAYHLHHDPTRLQSGGGVPEGWAGTVRTVTEMTADAMGVQAVLPVEYIRTEGGDDGGEDAGGTDG